MAWRSVRAAVRSTEATARAFAGPRREIFRHERAGAPADTLTGACPELDCVRGLLPRRVILAAERRAQAIGLGADRVLISADAITEEAYLDALAAWLGTSYERLDNVARGDCPLHDHELTQAAAAGLLPLRRGGRLTWIVAPRCLTARRLADRRRGQPQWLHPFRLSSSEQLRRFAVRHARNELGRRAAEGLHRDRPLYSNAPRAHGVWRIVAIALTTLGVAALPFVFAAALPVLGVALCALLLAAAALRLASVIVTSEPPPRPRPIPDDRLPIYTIICALYREAAVVRHLVAAIRALDYPPEKLDVKFVLEAGDRETRMALAELDLGPPFDIISAPAVGPRTKPKALNVALAFAQGSFSAVFDAEDVPEPDQLRRALDVFMSADDRLACVQASLTIDNTTDNWLTRMFTADYSGQFDAFLPALATMRLPVPLGGSSNHFRTAALRRIGGWDPYNVTEDADLGMRLYRLGYRSAVLPSTTYEEAPAQLMPWLKQRTRWYKGWMQTWLVHMRRPDLLWRQLGPRGAVAFQLLFAGNALSALVHPFFILGFCYALMTAPTLGAALAAYATPALAAVLVGGYASTIIPNAIGLWRRRLLAYAGVLALTPLYWPLLSIAAWRALWHLIYDPQRWEKTEHGLAKSSRLSRPEADDQTPPVTPPRRAPAADPVLLAARRLPVGTVSFGLQSS